MKPFFERGILPRMLPVWAVAAALVLAMGTAGHAALDPDHSNAAIAGNVDSGISAALHSAGQTLLLAVCAVWAALCVWRRWWPPRSFAHCAAESAFALVTLACIPGSASAEITSTFNFNISSGSFTASPQGIYTKPPITQQWTYRVAGPNSDPYLSGTSTKPTWNVRSSPVSGTAVATGNYLTSPLIQLGATVDQFILRIAHRYRLPGNGSGVPIDAGQVTYSIDNATFQPLLPNQWKSSGAVDATLKPYVTPSNWGSVAVPTFVPGVGSTPSIDLLKNGGASFTGDSAGFDAGNFVGSETLTVKFLQATETVQFRFANVNLGNNCGINGGWDLAFIEASFIQAPEPGSFTLAAVGGVLSVLGWMRRRTHKPGPRVTNGPPGQA